MMKTDLHLSIRQTLGAIAEPSFSAFASGLIPDLTRPMLGVRLPKLRALAKLWAKEDWRMILNEGLHLDTFEEVMLRGFLIGYAPMEWSERWQLIDAFVPLVDNWSVCDSCCATFTSVRKHRSDAWPALDAYLQSDRMYDQRFAVVMMMDHYLVEDFIERVLQAWRLMSPVGYYAEMAVGWGLSVAALKYPQRTLDVLRDDVVSCSCRKKACQKILESRRTPADYRAEILKLRAELNSIKE